MVRNCERPSLRMSAALQTTSTLEGPPDRVVADSIHPPLFVADPFLHPRTERIRDTSSTRFSPPTSSAEADLGSRPHPVACHHPMGCVRPMACGNLMGCAPTDGVPRPLPSTRCDAATLWVAAGLFRGQATSFPPQRLTRRGRKWLCSRGVLRACRSRRFDPAPPACVASSQASQFATSPPEPKRGTALVL